jgi:Tol biopolymer transport system component
VERITDDAAIDWDPAFAADGRLLWSSDRSGRFEIWMADARGGDARQVTRDGVDAENPGMTPDGRWIVYSSGNPRARGLYRVRPEGGAAERIVPGNVVMPELSPDGSLVAFVENLGSARAALGVARIEDGARLPFSLPLPPFVPAKDPDPGRCRWFPDGRALAIVDRAPDGGYAIYRHPFDAAGRVGRATRLDVAADYDAESFDLSPDGRRMIVALWERSSSLLVAENLEGVTR